MKKNEDYHNFAAENKKKKFDKKLQRINYTYKLYLSMRFYTILLSSLLATTAAMAEQTDSIKVGADLKEVSVIGFKQDRAALSPISQSEVGERFIQNNQIDNLRELSGKFANFFIPDYGSRQYTPIYIRGIGAKNSTPGAGVYVDGMPFFDRSVLDMDLFGISKVEVLRGPQGTLFGRNSMAGLINVYTYSPLEYQNTMAKISYGSYNDLQVMASTFNKLSDKLGISFSGNYHYCDGYFENTFLHKKADLMSNGTLRLGLAWQPSEKWLMRYNVSLDHTEQGGFPYAPYDSKSGKLGDVSYDEASGYRRFVLTTGMNWRYTGKIFDFDSQTSFQYSKDNVHMDQDFSKLHLFYVTMPLHQKMLSQEFTFRSNTNSRYHWIAGVFAFAQKNDYTSSISYYTSKNPMHAPFIKDNSNKIPTEGIAAYHVSKFDIYKGLSASVGLRYDYETSKVNNKTYCTITGKGNIPAKLIDNYESKLHYSQLTPRFTLQQQSSADKMVYATVARGYKAGGFNATKETETDRTYAPEYTWNYEVGTKLNFFDEKLSFEASAFYIDWKDQQLSFIIPAKGQVVRNVGHSDSKGFEVALAAKPFKNFVLQANYGYTYARFLSAMTGKKRDFTGNILPFVPRNTLSVNVNYAVYHIGFIDKLMFNANVTGVGKIYWREDNQVYQPFYSLLNLKLAATKGNFTWELWSKNTTSTNYMAYYFKSSREYGQQGKPFCIGTSLVYTLK